MFGGFGVRGRALRRVPEGHERRPEGESPVRWMRPLVGSLDFVLAPFQACGIGVIPYTEIGGSLASGR